MFIEFLYSSSFIGVAHLHSQMAHLLESSKKINLFNRIYDFILLDQDFVMVGGHLTIFKTRKGDRFTPVWEYLPGPLKIKKKQKTKEKK